MFHKKTVYLRAYTLIFSFGISFSPAAGSFPRAVLDRRGEFKCATFPSKNSVMSMVPAAAVVRLARRRPHGAAARASRRASPSPRARASVRAAAAAAARATAAANQQYSVKNTKIRNTESRCSPCFLCEFLAKSQRKIQRFVV